MSMAEGCVEGHSALIFDRGGRNRLSQLINLGQVEYGRERSSRSSASVQISARNCDAQADVINDIQSRRHEMVVYRGDERVWEGPIVQVQTDSTGATIAARDVTEYIAGTPLSKPWPPDTGTPVSASSALMIERVRTILEYELTTPYTVIVGTGSAAQPRTFPRWETIDPPANILPFLDIRESTTLLTRSTTEAMQMTVYEHLTNLAEGGLDFTAVGRSLVVWDSATALGRTRVLTEADFYGDPVVIQAGTDHWSVQHVSAQRPDPEDAAAANDYAGVGSAGAENDYYGVWTNISSLSSEEGDTAPTQDELNSQAQRGLVGRTPVPTSVRLPEGAGLKLSHDLGINRLVPGVIMPIRAVMNLRTLQQDQLLDAVKVTETAEGEEIGVTLVPAGDVEVVA